MDLQYVSRAREGDNRGVHPSGWGAVTLAANALKRKFEGAGTNVLSANKILRHFAVNRTANAAGGRVCVLCDAAEY